MAFYFSSLNERSVVPQRATSGSAGYDLSACEDAVVPPRGRMMIDTGVVVQFPCDHYARVAPRSGLTLKKGLDVGAGIIDSDFTSSIRVILFNHTDEPFIVNVGDRIAQLIFIKISTPEVLFVEYEHLQQTQRGTNGFGSTGV